MYKVLIVEDEDIIRKGLLFMVNWQDADCVVVGEAADGLKGLEKIRDTNPDIVVVDINMPVKDGLSMLEDSIEEYGYDAIIVSGYSDFEYARKAIRLGVNHYSSHLSLTDISEQCGMSCTYLNSKFKSFTGYTFNDYLNRYRMQKAVDLLKENKYKVYEIADLVGFSDYKYFIKVFKKYVGCSPVKFMEGGSSGPTP